MASVGEDELVCDFAEVYHITDIWSLPVQTAATLACGLGEDSRIRMKINGDKVPLNTLLLGLITDHLNTISWVITGAARQGKSRPSLVTPILRNNKPKKESKDNDLRAFDDPEDFDREWARLTGGNYGDRNC